MGTKSRETIYGSSETSGSYDAVQVEWLVPATRTAVRQAYRRRPRSGQKLARESQADE